MDELFASSCHKRLLAKRTYGTYWEQHAQSALTTPANFASLSLETLLLHLSLALLLFGLHDVSRPVLASLRPAPLLGGTGGLLHRLRIIASPLLGSPAVPFSDIHGARQLEDIATLGARDEVRHRVLAKRIVDKPQIARLMVNADNAVRLCIEPDSTRCERDPPLDNDALAGLRNKHGIAIIVKDDGVCKTAHVWTSAALLVFKDLVELFVEALSRRLLQDHFRHRKL